MPFSAFSASPAVNLTARRPMNPRMDCSRLMPGSSAIFSNRPIWSVSSAVVPTVVATARFKESYCAAASSAPLAKPITAPPTRRPLTELARFAVLSLVLSKLSDACFASVLIPLSAATASFAPVTLKIMSKMPSAIRVSF